MRRRGSPAWSVSGTSSGGVWSEWRCLPGRRALWLLFAGALPLSLSGSRPGVLWLVLLWDCAVMLGVFLDYAALRRSWKLEVSREVESRLSVGVQNKVKLHIENHGHQSYRVWMRDHHPGGFYARGGDVGTDAKELRSVKYSQVGLEGYSKADATVESERGVLGKGLSVKGGERVEVCYEVRPTERGDFVFGETDVRVESRLGLATVAVKREGRAEVKVYPNISGARRMMLASRLKGVSQFGLKHIRGVGGGGEFAKLRDYVEGDSYRAINWKATARMRRPISEVYEMERSQNVIICIDAGRLMGSHLGELTRLDRSINAGLMLAKKALDAGDRVGLMVFADEVQAWVPPRRSRGQYKRLLEALYGVEAKLCRVDYEAAARFLMRNQRQRSLVVLFTELQGDDQSGALLRLTRLLMQWHLPLCVTMKDGVLLERVRQAPEEEEALFERVAAMEVLRERELLKEGLLKLGAELLDKAPEEVTVETINRYMALKQRCAL